MKVLITKRQMADGLERLRHAWELVVWLRSPEAPPEMMPVPWTAPRDIRNTSGATTRKAWEMWLLQHMERMPPYLRPPASGVAIQADLVRLCALPSLELADQSRLKDLALAAHLPIRFLALEAGRREPTPGKIAEWMKSQSRRLDIASFALAWGCGYAVRAGQCWNIDIIWRFWGQQVMDRLYIEEVWAARHRILDDIMA